jgi:hypothetical protein
LQIAGKQVQIIHDHSVYDYELEKDYGHFSHLKRIFEYLETQLTEKKHEQVSKLLEVYVQTAKASTLWERLLTFLHKHATVFSELSGELLKNPGVYTNSKVR